LDLVPASLVVEHYLASEHKALEELQFARDQAGEALEAYVEEHGGEGGLLEEVVNEKGQVTKKALTDQVKELKEAPDLSEELSAAERARTLVNKEEAAKKAVNGVEGRLASETLDTCKAMTEDEIRRLVVDAKWSH